MPLRLTVRRLEPHVGRRGKLVKKSHGLVYFPSERGNVSLAVRSPVTRIPALRCFRLSLLTPEFSQRVVQLEVAD